MTRMFFDTGVLLAAYDGNDLQRRRDARWAIESALQSGGFVTSAHVLYEFHRLMVASHLLSVPESASVLRHLALHRVVACDIDSVLRATELQQRHGLKLGDALVVQAALDAGCRVIYSDTVPPGMSFESATGQVTLTALDPMARPSPLSAHEPAARYAVQREVRGTCAAMA